MFSRNISEQISLSLSIPQFAEDLFALTDKNRAFLAQWLPWLDHVQSPADSKKFIISQLELFTKGQGLHLCIFYQGRLAGSVGFNHIDPDNQIGYIGYWLGEEFNGRGIMTAAVREVIALGQQFYRLQKIDIRCASQNNKSQAIPERLGFVHEGTLQRAEKVNGQYFDHRIYSLLLEPQS